MNVRHLEQLKPVCPACRTPDAWAAVEVTGIERESDEMIIEGRLGCSNADCQHEYPIVDGIPILLPHVRQYVTDNYLSIMGRSDLSAASESMIGDCCGPNSAFDRMRQHVSSYAWSHYARWDPDEPADDADHSLTALLDEALVRAGPIPGPVLDAGCAVGGATFALAEHVAGLALGIDVHFAMLRVAAGVLRRAVVEYPRRRCGVVYDRRTFDFLPPCRDQVDFWACDATAMPFRPGVFGAAIGLHTLDSVASPLALLSNLAEAVAVGGKLILACPYDWTSAVTPVESWIGGHSQRGHRSGASDQILTDLLTAGAHPASIEGVRLIHQSDDLLWKVRWHERAMIAYRVHLVVAERIEP